MADVELRINAGAERHTLEVDTGSLAAGVLSIRFDQTKFVDIHEVIRVLRKLAMRVRETGLTAP